MRNLLRFASSPLIFHLVVLAIVSSATRPRHVQADAVVNTFTHVQYENNSTSPTTYTEANSGIPGTQYTFTSATSTTFTELKARAGVSLNFNLPSGQQIDIDTAVAHSTATSTWADEVQIVNAGSTGVSELLFFWDIDGEVSFSATTGLNGGYDVTRMRAETTLTSNIGGVLETEFDDLWDYAPGSVRITPATTTPPPISVAVPNLSRTINNGLNAPSIPVELTLTTTVDFELAFIDPELTSLTASATSDFGHTAKLLGVAILDTNQQVIPGAYLQSTSKLTSTLTPLVYPTAVPEPAIGLWMTGAAALALAGSRAARWRAAIVR